MHALSQNTAYKHNTSMHSFSDTERYAPIFESSDREKWQKPDEVVKRIGIKKGYRIADIGAGTGYFTRRFAAAAGSNGEVTGYDIETGMVEYMKKDSEKLGMKNYKARLIDPEKPDLPERYFDLIFLCDVYHHIQDRTAYFNHIKSSLKDNGRIIIVDFYKKNSPVGPPMHMKIEKEEVIREMSDAGYKNTRYIKFLPYQYVLEFVAKG